MPAPVVDLTQFQAPKSIGDIPVPVAAPAPAPSGPLSSLDLNRIVTPPVSGVSNTNVLPPVLGGPLSTTPASVPAPAPVKTVNSALTTTVAPPAPVPAPTPITGGAQTSLGSALAGFGANLESISENLTKQSQASAAAPAAAPGSLQDTLHQILTLNTKLGTKTNETNRINSDAGIADKTAQVNQLTNEYNSRSRFYDNEISKVQSQNPEGKSAQAISDEVNQLTRQKNSELADIAIQQSAASGNLKVATDIAQKKIDAEFEPLQQQVDNLKSYYSLAANNLTESEKMTAQAAITEKQSTLDEAKQKRLALYTEQIKQADPLYQAQVANERRLAAGGGATATERSTAAVAALQTRLSSGTPLKNGKLPVDTNGYMTPEAWKTFIEAAPSEGLSRDDFIKQFGHYVFEDPKSGISAAYGLSPSEKKVITGALPAAST